MSPKAVLSNSLSPTQQILRPSRTAKFRERYDVGVPVLAVYALTVPCESMSEELRNLDMRDLRDSWESLVQLWTLSPADRNETESVTGSFPNPVGVDSLSDLCDFGIVSLEAHPSRDVFDILALRVDPWLVQIAGSFLDLTHEEVDFILVNDQAWIAIKLEPELKFSRIRESDSEHVGVSSAGAFPVVLVDDEVWRGEVTVETKIPIRH